MNVRHILAIIIIPKRSMHVTHRWLDRCINHHENTPFIYDYKQTLFPIVQGSTYKDLENNLPSISPRGSEGNAMESFRRRTS